MFMSILINYSDQLKYASSVSLALRPREADAPILTIGPYDKMVTVFIRIGFSTGGTTSNLAAAFFA